MISIINMSKHICCWELLKLQAIFFSSRADTRNQPEGGGCPFRTPLMFQLSVPRCLEQLRWTLVGSYRACIFSPLIDPEFHLDSPLPHEGVASVVHGPGLI